MIATLKSGLLACLAALSVACVWQLSTASTEAPVAHLFDYQLSAADGTRTSLSPEEAARRLRDYDVVFFGEYHGHPGIHLAQMELLAALHRQNPDLTLSLEQFERDTQPVVDQYLAGEIGEALLIEQGRAWSNYSSSYRPMVEYARQNRLPVIAANAPEPMVICVGREGLAILDRYPSDSRQYVAASVDTSEGAYRDRFFRFMHYDKAHGKAGDNGRIERSFEAQALRDDTMAESIARHLDSHPERKVLHLNGNFHSEDFLGTVERLQKRRPDLNIAVIEAQFSGAQPSQQAATLLITVQPMPARFVSMAQYQEWADSFQQERKDRSPDCPAPEPTGVPT